MEKLAQLATEMRAETEALQAKISKRGEIAMKEALAEFFKDHPEVNAIGWAQYTPFFNDGEECTFSVHGVGVNFVDKAENAAAEGASDKDDDEKFDPETCNRYSDFVDSYGIDEKKHKALYKNMKAMNKAFESMSDVLKSVFGDHMFVVATRKKIYIRDFDHE